MTARMQLSDIWVWGVGDNVSEVEMRDTGWDWVWLRGRHISTLISLQKAGTLITIVHRSDLVTVTFEELATMKEFGVISWTPSEYFDLFSQGVDYTWHEWNIGMKCLKMSVNAPQRASQNFLLTQHLLTLPPGARFGGCVRGSAMTD